MLSRAMHPSKTRIQLLSDLHLEAQPSFTAAAAPDADVLVVAGDIGSYQAGSLLDARAGRDFGLAQFAAKSHGGRWPVVIYVPGNHEYDGGDFDEIHQELRRVAQSLGLIWLEREVLVLGNVRFVGTTLWSDFDALADTATRLDSPAAIKRREKAFRAANYYLRKAGTTRRGAPFLAEEVRAEALECQRWLRGALSTPFAGHTVVITHFAPSLRSADPRYGLVPGTAGFCNSLDELLPLADLWIHGHLHCKNDYTVPAEGRLGGVCRVLSNTLGYVAKGEQEQFQPTLVVDLPCTLPAG